MTKDDYKFYVPYLGTFIILLGATKLSIYYSMFGLNITSYLEFTEILTLFLNDLLYFIAIILLQNLWMFLLQPNSELESISKGIHETLTEKNILKRVYSYAVNGFNLFLLLIIWIIGIPFWLWFSKLPFTSYLYFLYGIIAVLILLTIVYETRRQWFIKFDEYPKMVYTNLLKLFILLLGLTISSAYTDYQSVKNNKKYIGTTIKLSDRCIISDSTYYFIGKTRNFIFMHDEKNAINDIIPMTEVKMLTEKKNTPR